MNIIRHTVRVIQSDCLWVFRVILSYVIESPPKCILIADIDNVVREFFSNGKEAYNFKCYVSGTPCLKVDLTLDKLKSLTLKQYFAFQNQQYYGKFSIITFEELIAIDLDANMIVGIYLKIKNSVFGPTSTSNGRMKRGSKINLWKHFLSMVIKVPTNQKSSKNNLFSYNSPKISLIDYVNIPTHDTNQTYAHITSDSYFAYIKDYVVGIGP
ncbi:hypothetical protein IEQ34_008105 [Dendrobium chrysotoxum]|uniref:Uncharacterized protein n=1 Tax=Dendrobium chrysotoxum TaxID=161865 RepID=A0AAV7H7E5_DENCH|nr:hypothetical protein IEQ34_008105 [Dendrobium chrysotoxum]